MTATTQGGYAKMKAPKGFDHTNRSHVARLVEIFEKKQGSTGWELLSFSEEDEYVVFVRGTSVMSTIAQSDGSELVSLGSDFKPSDAGKRVAILESSPGNEGKYVVELDPHLKRARIAPLTESELRVREATATTLGVKLYEVQISTRPDGGYDLTLPSSYLASKHDGKLQEITETVAGEFGWFFKVNQKTRVASMVPSDPPSFDPVYQFDFDAVTAAHLDSEQLWKIPIGKALGSPGEPNPKLTLDLSDSSGALIVGLAGAGKSVTVQSIIFSAKARGFDLGVMTSVDKKTDFAWAKPYVKNHMWGCDSVAQALTVAKLVAEEGERRGHLLDDYGVSKWQDLPQRVRAENPPLLLIADELAAMLTADKLPSGLSKEMKELPEFQKMQQDLMESNLLMTTLSTLPALYRAAGIRVVYLTQQPNERYGFSTKLKGNLPHRLMLGVSPSQSEKNHAFRTPEKVPDVPAHIAQDERVARGVGLAHLDGSEPVVFKGYFASLERYVEECQRRGFPTTSSPEPTPQQIKALVPSIAGDLDGDEEQDGYGKGERQLEDWEIGPDGKPLSGRERANAAKHHATIVAQQNAH